MGFDEGIGRHKRRKTMFGKNNIKMKKEKQGQKRYYYAIKN